MRLNQLNIYGVRNIQRIKLEPAPGINFITGKNGSGKSSLLEAIFILGRAKSFRTNHIRQVINFDHQSLIVSGQAIDKDERVFQLGIQFDDKQCTIKINQKNSFRAKLAHCFPVLIIHPKSYQLIDAGPQIRREFMDWGVFNLDSEFLTYWRKFKKSLQQRNHLLKQGKFNLLNVWDAELVEYGIIISQYRANYIRQLQPLFAEITQEFLDLKQINVAYHSGWNDKKSFLDALHEDQNKDQRYGLTHNGPHRGGFSVLVNGRQARDFVSRGQLKLLMISLKLAQIKLINLRKKHTVCLLVDDLTSELDIDSKAKLLNYLTQLNCQVFITNTEMSNFGCIKQLQDTKMFHVEHGDVLAVD